LLRANANPSEPEIRAGMAANICRCTGYIKIIEAVQEAAKEITAASGGARGHAHG
jgi:carbon-monoxide dehydrogenase small subunit